MAGDVEDAYPLSPMQRAMLSHSLSSPGSGSYVQHAICDLREQIDAALLERAWRNVVGRHRVLRTAFDVEGTGEPLQIVHRDVAVPWTHDDWTGLAADGQERRFDLYVDADRQRDFDPSRAPLMRLALFRLADGHSRLLWTYHHALLDGRSVRIALREVFDLYDAHASGRELQLPPPLPFREHIDWLAKQDVAAARHYWRRELAGHPGPTTPAGYGLPPGGDSVPVRYAAHEIRLAARSTAALRNLARDRRLTLNTLVLGAWAQLLGRYAGETDVSFGTTITLRGANPGAFGEMVGLLINTVPLRVTLPPEMPLSTWLEGLRAQWLAMRAHAWAPLAKIRQWGGITRENALFSTLVVFENASLDAVIEADRESWTTRRFGRKSAAAHPLTLVGFGGTELSLKIVYRQSLFRPAFIVSMLEHLRTLLEGSVADLEKPLAQQSLLTAAERKRLLIDWNDTGRTFRSEACVHRLFERQAERTPDAVAVEAAGRTMTYRVLNERSNQLAHYLRRSGVVTDTLVGLCMHRSPEVIVAMLGIMKAGGAYLPLDAGNPSERTQQVIADARLATVITTRASAPPIDGYAERVVRLDDDGDAIAGESTTDGEGGAGLDDLAYAVYTSGSTGQPKGILVSHRALANHTLALLERYAYGPADRRLQFVSIGSDVLIAEVFPVLLAGGTLVLRPDAGLLSIADFLRFLEDRKITIAGLPSAYWHEWAAAMADGPLPFPSSLRLVISGMDRVRPDLFAVWKRTVNRRVRWFNAYGPSETTCTAATYEADPASDETPSIVPIGRPLPNVRIFVLDAHARPVPVGVPGEICIGGRGLARGYLNRPDLTAAKFVPEPFGDDPSNRLYRTGDVGRYLPDGNIEFLGRVDDQVKIRGYRVELGEVEAALRRLPEVREACVVARGETEDARRLIAYIVAAAGTQPDPSGLRALLRRSLPEYMVPAAIVALAAIPLAISGKVDQRALPEVGVDAAPAERQQAAAATPLEIALTAIWEALLCTRVGVSDRFVDLGGDSLCGVRLVHAVRSAFDVDIPVAALFDDAGTVAGMASRIDGERAHAT